MPVLIVDGERYRVPFMPFFRGYRTNNERWLTYNAKIVRSISLNFTWREKSMTITFQLLTVNICSVGKLHPKLLEAPSGLLKMIWPFRTLETAISHGSIYLLRWTISPSKSSKSDGWISEMASRKRSLQNRGERPIRCISSVNCQGKLGGMCLSQIHWLRMTMWVHSLYEVSLSYSLPLFLTSHPGRLMTILLPPDRQKSNMCSIPMRTLIWRTCCFYIQLLQNGKEINGWPLVHNSMTGPGAVLPQTRRNRWSIQKRSGIAIAIGEPKKTLIISRPRPGVFGNRKHQVVGTWNVWWLEYLSEIGRLGGHVKIRMWKLLHEIFLSFLFLGPSRSRCAFDSLPKVRVD